MQFNLVIKSHVNFLCKNKFYPVIVRRLLFKFVITMFNIPNLFTASNLLCGIIAIISLLSGRWDWACYLIYIAAILDFLDGFIARKLNQMSELGKQLDSLADMVTFGVAPGILVFALLVVQTGPAIELNSLVTFHEKVGDSMSTYLSAFADGSWAEISLLPFVALIIPFFSLFRLAKFNIDTRQSTSFIGVPTPANTIFFTAFPLVWMNAYANDNLDNALLQFMINPITLVVLAVVMGYMLVAELPLFALKFRHFKWKGNEIRFLFLIGCLLLLGLFHFWGIAFIILLYIVLSIIDNQISAK